jgi:hypothetical protein
VDVDLTGELPGATRWTPDETGAAPHEVALEVRPERFFAEYFGALEGAGGGD